MYWVATRGPDQHAPAQQGPPRCEQPRESGWPGNVARLQIHHLDAGYGPGSDRGSPNDGRTLFSKRVMALIWSPARVRT
jgi:hypothetical protein